MSRTEGTWTTSRNKMKDQNTKTLILAAYSIMAVLFFILESVIPKPIPFLRIGFANVFILLILVQLGFSSAMVVTLTKVVIGNLFLGLLFTPLVLFSFLSSIISLLVMFILLRSGISFSFIGISIAGAISHLLIQLVLGYFLFVHSTRIFALLPAILAIGLISGLITGTLVIVLINKIHLTIELP